MNKLAVLFPGIGYTCDKPLLYYAASAASDHGYEIHRFDYGQDIHTFHGRTPEELEPVIKLALKRSLRQLDSIDFSYYDKIVFISKSIGTVIACEAQNHFHLEKKALQFLLTPIPPSIPYLKDIRGKFFAGTTDPYITEAAVRNAAKCYPDKTGGIFENCNHSLEHPGDTPGNLKNLRQIIECLNWLLEND